MVPDMMLPSYLERQLASGPTDTWTYVPSAGDADIESARTHGDGPRCSFTHEPDGFHLILTYSPVGMIHRLCYYAEPEVAKTMGDALDRGSRFGHLYMHATLIGAAAGMNMRASLLPKESRLDSDQLTALGGVLAYSNSQIEKWEEIFNREKDSNRNARGRARRKIIGRRFVGRMTY